MQTEYSLSVNLRRDFKRKLNYIVTTNAKESFNVIIKDFAKGQRAFTIIGNYGTGKSAFLWAVQQHLSNTKQFFKQNIFKKIDSVDFLNVEGQYKSIIEVLADNLNVDYSELAPELILSEIYNKYIDLRGSNKLLVITVDEFGKFLEYAANNNPEKELYFIQQLAELVNNTEYNILLLFSIHQNFDAYSYQLTNFHRQEWTKVRGRLREIIFNEPIEQLLFLAAEKLIGTKSKKRLDQVSKICKLYSTSRAFSINKSAITEIASRLYPLDIFSASILTLALQKYGQNERSLFSFLESSDNTSINFINKESDGFYNIPCVYEYLKYNFYTYINSKFNPDLTNWTALNDAIHRIEGCETINDKSTAISVITTIGLLNIFSQAGSKLDAKFLESYAKLTLNIENPELVLKELLDARIIEYRNYANRYVISLGTDLDIQSALIAAEEKILELTYNVSDSLKTHVNLIPNVAKEYTYTTGTTRIFDYIISEDVIHSKPTGEIDGFINLIFNPELKIEDVLQKTRNENEAIIYGLYRNTSSIKTIIRDIDKTLTVKQENIDDKIAVRELNNILFYQKNLLNHIILDGMYNANNITWVVRGEVVNSIHSKRTFNTELSNLCRRVYNATPIFKNELVNKNRISKQIYSARRNFLDSLMNNSSAENFGFAEDKFPPEKSIYLTFTKNDGLNLKSLLANTNDIQKNSSFYELWSECKRYLSESKSKRQPINGLINRLNQRPFGLKKGLIEYWLPIFLYINRDDFALFNENGFVPNITGEILELITKNPGEYQIKAFDIEGIKLEVLNKYRLLLEQEIKEGAGNSIFIETIRPFLTFYRKLPEYSKYTKRLSNDGINIRNAIANSSDPEKTFYFDFPEALGFNIESLKDSNTSMVEYIDRFQRAIKEIRTCYDGLVNRIELFISEEILGHVNVGFEFRKSLRNRFSEIKRHLLMPKQKVFIERIYSEIPDNNLWLASIIQATMDVQLEKFSDTDEIIFHDRFKKIIAELDTINEMSKYVIDENNEEIMTIQITEFLSEPTKKVIRFPLTKLIEINKIEQVIRSTLSGNKDFDRIALTKILIPLLND